MQFPVSISRVDVAGHTHCTKFKGQCRKNNMANLERSKQPPPLQPQVSRRSARTRSTTSDGVKGEQSDKGKWGTVKESIIE